jgi:hypothetical protein
MKPLTLALGIVAVLTLVQGCSNEGEAPLAPPTPGDTNPDDTTGGENNGSGDEAKAGDPATPPAGENPAQAPPPGPKEKSKMTFFVTSTGNGAQGGNLGGLAGADKKCQDLAAAAGGGDHTWHAYLSVQGTNAKDRIGKGPWTNQKGTVIAADLAALHLFNHSPPVGELVDEKGAAVPANRSMLLTGSTQEGNAVGQTCNNWTSNNNNQTGRVGDANWAGNPNIAVHWNDARKAYSCGQQGMNNNKGEGRFYCFAID